MGKRIEFANTIRGVASVIVMLAHYIISFSAFSGGYGGLPPIDGGVFTNTAEILGFGMASFSYGAFGVALFFLVSGFVIPLSLTKLTKQKFGILAFAISRILRIWPVYIVGFCISLIFRWFSFHNSNMLDDYTILDVLSHITLFRDWIGGIPLDGVAWTLEIEIKFYLISAIFAYATVNGKQYITLFSISMAFICYYLKNNPESYFLLPISFLNCFQFIVFMTIGTNLFLLYSGVISRNKATIWIAASLVSFIYVAQTENKVGYIIAFLVFLSCYIGRDSFTGGKITSFFAKISYPMYVVHALFGYVTMWYMISIGINQYIALIIQVAITIYISYLIHKYVEVKSQLIGKRASELVTGYIKIDYN
ncbi:acyltransferase family protein, partial [Citrobacter cronae]|uniref:acyltransferase family protein n=1 Tax=Citrobacter cronae TaxID=1748967 RepID=UPI0035107188